jgi:hypothetical protein
MYAELVAWCRRHMLRPELHLAHPEDIALPICVEDGPGILQILREHHAAWVAARKKRTSGSPPR